MYTTEDQRLPEAIPGFGRVEQVQGRTATIVSVEEDKIVRVSVPIGRALVIVSRKQMRVAEEK